MGEVNNVQDQNSNKAMKIGKSLCWHRYNILQAGKPMRTQRWVAALTSKGLHGQSVRPQSWDVPLLFFGLWPFTCVPWPHLTGLVQVSALSWLNGRDLKRCKCCHHRRVLTKEFIKERERRNKGKISLGRGRRDDTSKEIRIGPGAFISTCKSLD